MREWNPLDHREWAAVLGLVPVPLFGCANEEPDKHTVLLDGQRSSFAISACDDGGLATDPMPLSWSWSSNIRHMLILDKHLEQMTLRRWDTQDTRRFRLPTHSEGAKKLLELLEDAPAPRGVDVISHVLRAFRHLRAVLPAKDTLDAIRIFNSLLIGVSAVGQNTLDKKELLECRTVGQAIDAIGLESLAGAEANAVEASSRDCSLGDLLSFFLNPEPISQARLNPDLLLRHAAGQLYQEAHFAIERDQFVLPGIGEDRSSPNATSRDVRFTPTTLARLLVQQAFEAFGDFSTHSSISILDPACGSGVFLLEALRELEFRGFKGTVNLNGMDVSSISCAMARFCLAQAENDAAKCGITLNREVIKANALQRQWGSHHVILMNPPFVSWESMAACERDEVIQTLDHLYAGRADKAMAFIWKAVEQVRDGGVVASVMPSALFETKSGIQWREELLSCSEPCLLGRFNGYGDCC
ncbi:MAG: SAM-dependent methyltransferase, partial [Chloroflexi bacterium]|nr:SAM-dependent methyltransferase [Chloroflexota bacterium]